MSMSVQDPAGYPGAAGESLRRVVVVGLGNVLTGDDAAGPTAVRVLDAEYEMPPQVEVVDAGTPGMDLASLLADADAAVVVDSVKGDEPPGTVKLYDRAALVARPLQPRTNPHAPGLVETLLSLDFLGLGPARVLLVGVVPGPVEVGVGLSPALSAAVPALVAAVTAELEGMGLPPLRREDPAPPDLWWMKSPALAGTVT